jgi:protein SCO1/2
MLVAAVAAAAMAALAVVLGVALGNGGDARSAKDRDYRGSRPPSGLRVPRFALRDYRGAVVTSKELRGKAIALTFLDSQCTDACPVIARQLAAAWKLLAPGERARMAAYAISVDPSEDTPAAVRRFLRRQRAERALGYLVGSTRALRPVWNAFQILPSLDTGEDDVHSAPVRIYDPNGVWVSTLHPGADLTPRHLAHDLRLALLD